MDAYVREKHFPPKQLIVSNIADGATSNILSLMAAMGIQPIIIEGAIQALFLLSDLDSQAL